MKADEAGFSAPSRDAAWTLGSSLATRKSQNLYAALADPSIIAWARMTTLMMNLAVVGCGWFKVVIRSQSLAGLGCLRAARKGLPGATSCLSTDWIRLSTALHSTAQHSLQLGQSSGILQERQLHRWSKLTCMLDAWTGLPAHYILYRVKIDHLTNWLGYQQLEATTPQEQ